MTAADIDAAVVFVALRADAEVLIADRLVGLSLSHFGCPFLGIMRDAAARGFSVGVSSKIARKRGRARLRGGRTS